PVVPYPPSSNPGIEVPADDAYSNDSNYSDSNSENGYTDFLDTSEPSRGAEDPAAESEHQASTVDYATVLARYVASLDKENRTQDILALYAGEIKKYGD